MVKKAHKTPASRAISAYAINSWYITVQYNNYYKAAQVKLLSEFQPMEDTP